MLKERDAEAQILTRWVHFKCLLISPLLTFHWSKAAYLAKLKIRGAVKYLLPLGEELESLRAMSIDSRKVKVIRIIMQYTQWYTGRSAFKTQTRSKQTNKKKIYSICWFPWCSTIPRSVLSYQSDIIEHIVGKLHPMGSHSTSQLQHSN